MAALPPDPLFALPFRLGVPKKTDWSLVTRFVRTHHGTKINVAPAVDKLNTLRHNIINCCSAGGGGGGGGGSTVAAINEAFVDGSLRPYIRLVVLAQGHLPLHSSTIPKLIFCWKNAWDESVEVKSDNATVEVLSCIYNVAAAYAAIARAELLSNTAEGAKQAFKFFQMAAGVYDHVATVAKRLPSQEVASDFTPEALQLCRHIALVQAHHCSFVKANHELRGKTGILSKIAVEAAHQYSGVAEACRAAPNGLARSALGAALLRSCETYARVFFARAHMLHGADRMGAEEIGAALGRFKCALDEVQAAAAAAAGGGGGGDRNLVNAVGHLRHHIGELHTKALHENETVHFERATKEFPPLERLGKLMGKATECESFVSFSVKREDDPFFGIVPAHVTAIVTKVQQTMRSQVQQVSESVAEHRSRIRESINQLGVIAAIQALSSEGQTKGRVPETLRAKIVALRSEAATKAEASADEASVKQDARGGLVQALLAIMAHTTEVTTSITESLAEIARLLREEEEEDLQFRGTYGDKLWGELRQPSAGLPDVRTLKKLAHDIQQAVAREVTAPTNGAKSMLDGNLRELSRLDWPLEDLDALMPFTRTQAVAEADSAVAQTVSELKHILARIDQVEEIESAKLRELRELLDGDALARQLSAATDEQQDAVQDAVMGEFTDRIAVVTSTMSSADALVDEAQDRMAGLAELRSGDAVATEIQTICNGIEVAMNLYRTLRERLKNIASSAETLSEQASNALMVAQSFREGRRIEAKEFAEDLERRVAATVHQMQPTSQSRQAELQRQIEQLEQQQQRHQQRVYPQQQQQQQQLPQQGYMPQQQQLNAIFGADPPAAPPRSSPPPGYTYEPQFPPPPPYNYGGGV